MKHKLGTIEISDNVVEGLNNLNGTQVESATANLRTCEKKVTESKVALVRASDEVTRLPVEVASGRSSTADLEASITAEQAAALELVAVEGKVEPARQGLAAAEQIRREMICELVGKKIEDLQGLVDKVVPMLKEVKECECILYDLIESRCKNPLASALHVGSYHAEALEWPMSVADEANIIAATGTAIDPGLRSKTEK